nr:MarR family winged helix-turn-helix transcriptional regulator [Ruegeria sp. 6PALISEP08]
MSHVQSEKNDDFDLQNFLPFLLNQASERASLEFQSVYKGRYGMLRTEWRVLFHLGLFGEMTAKDIGERAKMHKTKISRAVAKLEQRRYLKRTRDEADRRAEWLALTPAGQTVYRDLRNVAANYDARLSSLFNEEEAALLRHMLQRLAGLD